MREIKIPRILERQEVASMFAASDPMRRDNILLKSLYFMGLTNREAQQLMVEHIDFTTGVVNVDKRGDVRQVPVPRSFLNELAEYIGVRQEGPLFHGKSRNMLMSDRHIRRIVKGYAKEAAIPGHEEIHPHTLRHSYMAHLKQGGASIEAIRNLLGHVRKETTSLYARAADQKKF